MITQLLHLMIVCQCPLMFGWLLSSEILKLQRRAECIQCHCCPILFCFARQVTKQQALSMNVEHLMLIHFLREGTFVHFHPWKVSGPVCFRAGRGVDTTRYYSPRGFLLQRQCAGPLRAAWPVAREQSYLFILPQTKALSCKFSVNAANLC